MRGLLTDSPDPDDSLGLYTTYMCMYIGYIMMTHTDVHSNNITPPHNTQHISLPPSIPTRTPTTLNHPPPPHKTTVVPIPPDADGNRHRPVANREYPWGADRVKALIRGDCPSDHWLVEGAHVR